jgi:hypothetical protein
MSETAFNTFVPTTFGLAPRRSLARRDPADGALLAVAPPAAPAVATEYDGLPGMDQFTPSLRQRVIETARQPQYLALAIALPVLSGMAAWTLARWPEVARQAGIMLGLF